MNGVSNPLAGWMVLNTLQRVRGEDGGVFTFFFFFFSRTKAVGSKISTVAAAAGPLSRPSSVAVWVPRVPGIHFGWHPPSTSSSVLVYVIVSTPCFNEMWTMSFNTMVSKLREIITHFHYADFSDEIIKCCFVSIACTKLLLDSHRPFIF